jgi:hypothetical protein
MKKLICIAITTVFILLVGYNAFARDSFVCDTTEKAEELWEFNYQADAIACLQVLDKTNKEVNFLLGKYLLLTAERPQDYQEAFRRLDAKPVLKKYGAAINALYEQEANKRLKNGNLDVAKVLFWKLVKNDQTYKNTICMMLYDYGNSSGDETCFSYYKAMQDFCGSQYDKAIGQRFLAIAKEKSKSERKQWIHKASYFISKEEIEAVFPPPTWQTVYKKTFIGKGYGKGEKNKVPTVQAGKDLMYGDKIIISGAEFQVYSGGRWKQFVNKKYEIKNKSRRTSGILAVKAPAGEKFSVEIQRLIANY